MTRRSATAARARRWLASGVGGSPLVSPRVRAVLLRAAGATVARGATVQSRVFIKHPQQVRIGAKALVNDLVYLDGDAPIDIGAGAALAMRVTVLNASHEMGPSAKRTGPKTAQAVTIGPGAWIGAGAVILPGVTIGAGTVVAAGAVVTKDCAADTLYAGVPARQVRSLA